MERNRNGSIPERRGAALQKAGDVPRRPLPRTDAPVALRGRATRPRGDDSPGSNNTKQHDTYLARDLGEIHRHLYRLAGKLHVLCGQIEALQYELRLLRQIPFCDHDHRYHRKEQYR